jgi:hypothetical protein
MKKTIFFLSVLIIGCMTFQSCNSAYDNQPVAKPKNYKQLILQDTTGFAAVLKAGISPLKISATNFTSPLSLLTCTAVLNRIDTTTNSAYRMDFSNVSTFANYKTIAFTFNGKAGSDITVGCKEFNDSIKRYNKNAIQRTVYIRLISFIQKNGLNAAFTSKTLSLLVTPYNYPPVALNDVATLPMNSSININVLANDTDPEGDTLKVTATTAPTHGTIAINTDGTIKYIPTTGFSGSDSFSYTISDGNGNTSTANVDITILAVNPFSAVTVRPWFLIGAAIGDGNWNNSTSGLGVSIFPLSVVTGNVYNSTGDGQFTYTGYLQAGKGFKLIRDYFSTTVNWNESWGMTGSTYVHDGGDNITVAADGYYTISLNSIANTLTIVPTPAANIPSGSFAPMAISGDFNGWSATANPMTAVNSTNNHQWYTTVNLTSPNGLKFNSNAWTTSWGSNDFPVGIGSSSNGPNIPDVVGKYTVLFNDIDGCYYFIKVP